MTESAERSVLDQLIAVRAMIEDEKNWCQGSIGGPGEAKCLLGAILYSGSESFTGRSYYAAMISTPIRNLLRTAVYKLFPERRVDTLTMGRLTPLDPIVLFNDHLDTTHADVLCVLDDAIATARKEHESC